MPGKNKNVCSTVPGKLTQVGQNVQSVYSCAQVEQKTFNQTKKKNKGKEKDQDQ